MRLKRSARYPGPGKGPATERTPHPADAEQPGPQRLGTMARRLGVIVAGGVLVGGADILPPALAHDFENLAQMIRFWDVAIVFFTVVLGVAWLFVGWPLSRLCKLSPGRALPAWVAGLGVFIAWELLHPILIDVHATHLGRNMDLVDVPWLVMRTAVSGAFGAGIYRATGMRRCLARESRWWMVTLHWGGFALAGLILAASIWAIAMPSLKGARDHPSVPAVAPSTVVLVSIDALRADMLSCYGNERFPTPSLDRLAADGVVFERAVSAAPWTLPAVASFMTGQQPEAHHALEIGDRLPGMVPMLAEQLRDAGYVTGALGLNPHLKRHSGLARGFQSYRFYPVYLNQSLAWGVAVHLLKVIPGTAPTSSDLTEEAIAWLQDHRRQPVFFWLHYFDPHLPYEPPTRFIEPSQAPTAGRFNDRIGHRKHVLDVIDSLTDAERRRIRHLYEGEVRYVDRCFGRLTDTLRWLKRYRDALIVVTSDHGEEFFEHGGFEHGHTLYQEVLHVPLIIKLPGMQKAGERRPEFVPTAAVATTILEQCGLDWPEPPPNPALDLAATGAQSASGKPIVSTGILYGPPADALIVDGMKYIRWREGGRRERYDLRADPAEQHDVFTTGSATAQSAESMLMEIQDRARDQGRVYESHDADADRSPSRQDIEALKALGYL